MVKGMLHASSSSSKVLAYFVLKFESFTVPHGLAGLVRRSEVGDASGWRIASPWKASFQRPEVNAGESFCCSGPASCISVALV